MFHTHDAVSKRSEIDVAVGVLIALHGLGRDDAFAHLAARARNTGAGLVPSARAVIALAQGRSAA